MDKLMTGLQKSFGQTPSQTVGPYFAYGLTATQYSYEFDQPFDDIVALPEAAGEHIRLEGLVIDGDGKVIPDAMIEISQADSRGKYPKTVEETKALNFRAFGRTGTGTDRDAKYYFQTVKPGVETPGEAPHINLIVSMRGILLHAFTRVYFDDESTANAKDAVLQSVPEARRNTLVAKRSTIGGQTVYRFDIYMQGDNETVFFDV